MAGLDSYETARRIRLDNPTGTLCLVALGGWGEDEDMRRTREAGFDHHLAKPAPVEALRRLLTNQS